MRQSERARRLYHSVYCSGGKHNPLACLLILLLLGGTIIAGCSPPQKTQAEISVSLVVDDHTIILQVPAGSSAQQAFFQAGISLSALDRSEPPLFTILSNGSTVKLIRIEEKFEVEQQIIPFDRQTIRNDSLPEGDARISQSGSNGKKEITYRILVENGKETSRSVVKEVILTEPVTEIMMVGGQTPYQSLTIKGRLVYLAGGNAWLMEGTTGERKLLVSTGDLDGRVFNLSPDGSWLVFTRGSKDTKQINTLWAVRTNQAERLIDLKISNVVHFASFADDNFSLGFSTVEPRSTAPGWQANNDLQILGLGIKGLLTKPSVVLDVNSGGVYGWWGANYSWMPGGQSFVAARPDGIYMIDRQTGEEKTILEILPFQTGGDWAWVPGISCSPGGKVIYAVNHSSNNLTGNAEQTPNFDLVAIPLAGGAPVTILKDVGMFAYPVVSSGAPNSQTNIKSTTSPASISSTAIITGTSAGNPLSNFQIAFLQAISPLQSDTSKYRLDVMDRDGSNQKVLFPDESLSGLEPQKVVWSPMKNEDGNLWISLIYQGNIWLVDSVNGKAQQITGEGVVSRIDWR